MLYILWSSFDIRLGCRITLQKKLAAKPRWLTQKLLYRKSLRSRLYFYNTLPGTITSQPTMKKFKNHLRKYMLLNRWRIQLQEHLYSTNTPLYHLTIISMSISQLYHNMKNHPYHFSEIHMYHLRQIHLTKVMVKTYNNVAIHPVSPPIISLIFNYILSLIESRSNLSHGIVQYFEPKLISEPNSTQWLIRDCLRMCLQTTTSKELFSTAVSSTSQ